MTMRERYREASELGVTEVAREEDEAHERRELLRDVCDREPADVEEQPVAVHRDEMMR